MCAPAVPSFLAVRAHFFRTLSSFGRFCLLLLALLALPSHVYAQCPAANPNDWNPDDKALNDCLAGQAELYLDRGNPGYIINTGLRLHSNLRLLTSSGSSKAILLAGADLVAPMIEMISDDASGYTISELIFDGNKYNRQRTDRCADGAQSGDNLYLKGVSFVVHHIDTVNAMCRSGMDVIGTGYEIYSVFAADNGRSADEATGQWSDGINLIRCTDGYVHHNDVYNNTDVGIVVVTGAGCRVMWNNIQNTSRYAFAGLHIAGGQNADLSGSTIAYNGVSAGQDLMSFGIVIGPHAWRPDWIGVDAGTIFGNYATGAVVNIAVDGIQAGAIFDNEGTNARGSRGKNCSYSANYVASDFGSASIGDPYICRRNHPGDCSNVCG